MHDLISRYYYLIPHGVIRPIATAGNYQIHLYTQKYRDTQAQTETDTQAQRETDT